LRLTGVGDVLLSHGHLDHALGLPFLLSHRSMQREQPATRILCPLPTAERLERFVRAASELEERVYDYEILGMQPGDRHELRGGFSAEAFASEHPVASVGYHLWRKRRSLAPRFLGLEPAELERLRAAGEELSAEREEIVMSYCGDTGPGVFAEEPRLFETPLLMIEITYLGDQLRERGRQYGHMHIEDLVAQREHLQNDALVLFHLSRRHRPAELRLAVDELLPDLAERVHVLGAERPPEAES
jgi:ribonuclease Z